MAGWKPIFSGGLGALALAHCTGARDPLNSRVAALEQRMAELERSDASSPEAEAVDASVDAPADWHEPGAIHDASYEAPAWTDAGWCEGEAHRACQGRITPAAGALRNADAARQFVWRRMLDLDSPQGQRCLREERERCERIERHAREQQEWQARRLEEFYRWLDGQLSPNRVDARFSLRVETRMLQALVADAAVAPKVKISCVLEFCRIEYEAHPHRPDLHYAIVGSLDWQPLSSISRMDPTNPPRYTFYVTRPGWAMPPPLGESPVHRDTRFRKP